MIKRQRRCSYSVTTATRKKANWVQWKIWAAGTRWAEAGEAGLLFFSFLYFSSSSVLLFAIEFQEKEKIEIGRGLERFQNRFQARRVL
jgi:hypothetical protein